MNHAAYEGTSGTSSDVPPSPHAIQHRRTIGAFYTPLSLTEALCDWGLRSKEDLALEPCFGGCTFLEAAVSRLRSLGQHRPEQNLFGCDIDPLAFRFLKSKLGVDTKPSHFSACDFLTLTPHAIGGRLVDLAAGNPPFIRPQNFTRNQRAIIDQWTHTYGIKLGGRASLWAYFVIHATHFLKRGGRVAWVLPNSFLTARYATAVRNFLVSKFARVEVITLSERLFISEGTEELTVVVLAEGFGENVSPVTIQMQCLDNTGDLAALLRRWHSKEPNKNVTTRLSTGLVPTEASNLLNTLCADPSVVSLGDIAAIEIGVVTGDAKFFVRSASEWKALGIDRKYLQYIAPRSQWLDGISLDLKRADQHEREGIRCLALDCPADPRALALQTYLSRYEPAAIEQNSTFARRPIWYRFLDTKVPDAFLVFMTNWGPRLILNRAKANCTNSLYRVRFHSRGAQSKLTAISFISTFTQLSAELCGHGRGSGALKLDPGNAQLLKLYLPNDRPDSEVNLAFSEIDKLLVNGELEEARKVSDEFLFGRSPIFLRSLPVLVRGLVAGRQRRMRVVQANVK